MDDRGAGIVITMILLVNAGLDLFQEYRELKILMVFQQRLNLDVIVQYCGEPNT